MQSTNKIPCRIDIKPVPTSTLRSPPRYDAQCLSLESILAAWRRLFSFHVISPFVIYISSPPVEYQYDRGLTRCKMCRRNNAQNHWMNAKELRQHNGTRMHVEARLARQARAKPKPIPVKHTSANASGDADPQVEATG